jgi:acyl carrier protein
MSNDDLRRRVRAAIANALGLDESALAEPATTETVERWDSLGHFHVIETLAETFGLNIAHDESVTLVSEDAIVETLLRRQQS